MRKLKKDGSLRLLKKDNTVEERSSHDTRGSTFQSDGNIGRDNGGSSQVVEEAVAAAHGRGHMDKADGREQQNYRCRGKRWRTRLPFEAVARAKWYCLLMREVGGVTRDGNKCSPIEYL
jgi:hypothetical protein